MVIAQNKRPQSRLKSQRGYNPTLAPLKRCGGAVRASQGHVCRYPCPLLCTTGEVGKPSPLHTPATPQGVATHINKGLTPIASCKQV